MRRALVLLACVLAAPAGAEPWSFAYDGPGDDRLTGAWPLPDGSSLVTGTTVSWTASRAAWMLRLGPAGEILWERALGEAADPWGLILEHDDLGATCVTDGSGNVVARIEADGRLAWAVTPSGIATVAAPLSDGGCVVGGALGDDAFVARLDDSTTPAPLNGPASSTAATCTILPGPEPCGSWERPSCRTDASSWA